MGVWIALAVGAVVVLLVIWKYNSIISHRNQVDNAFGSMDAMLKQRYDLIPNLVSTVQTYVQHERGVLEELTALRTRAASADLSAEEHADLDGKTTHALSALRVAVENYPDLKANRNFLQLQASLNEVEEKVGAARRNYNRAVTDYNTAIESFPGSLMAARMHLQRKPVFEIVETERHAPDVKAVFNG